jgi:hypothetical protein
MRPSATQKWSINRPMINHFGVLERAEAIMGAG